MTLAVAVPRLTLNPCSLVADLLGVKARNFAETRPRDRHRTDGCNAVTDTFDR